MTIPNLIDVEIETPRVRLVPISMDHCRDIFVSFTPAVARYTFPQPTGNIAHIEGFIRGSRFGLKRGDDLQVVALNGQTDEFIGCAGLHHLTTKPEPGIWLKESMWGKGYGTEIIAALKKWADFHLDYSYLFYPVHRDNWPSRRIPERLGGVYICNFVDRNARGERFPMVEYRIYRGSP